MSDDGIRALMEDFLTEAAERVAAVEDRLLALSEASEQARQALLGEAKRELHTLKGNAGMMGLTELQSLAHRLEDEVEALPALDPDVSTCLQGLDHFRQLLAGQRHPDRRGALPDPASTEQGQTSVRVPFAALDELVDLLAEMVIFRNRLGNAIFRGHASSPQNPCWEEIQSARDALGKTLGLIQDRVMQLRMVPLLTLFGHLHRIVHDESRREGKRARFETAGGDTPVDKALLEVCSEAVGHLVRNAVVHGIEPPDLRAAAGKPAEGRITLRASTHGNEVWIDVEDDGRGVDREGVMAAAAARGLELPPGADPVSLLFAPGFSTRSNANVAAGRGMGLSAAMAAVQRLGGRVEVVSEPGAGSRFGIRLPLTVSITRVMLLRADGEEYALPLAAIEESVRLRPGEGHHLNHAGVVRWRGRLVPVLDVGYVMGTADALRERGFVVVIGAEGKNRGLVVDELAGIREIVVKGLDPIVGSPPGVSGSTILGDGQVRLILDPNALASLKPFITDPARGNGASKGADSP